MPEAGRVIAGASRGLRLVGPGPATRPLGDRAKEVLFGSLEGGRLGPWPVAFLDLFAGSGAGGIEALSRGAPRATFVERAPAAVAAIRTNLERLGPELASLARVEPAEVLAFLAAGGARGGGPYGAVLVDPPYGDATLEPALERLAEAAGGWLEAEGVVVTKHFWRSAPAASIGGLVLVRRRRLGETTLSIYRPAPAAGANEAGRP